MTTPWSGSTNIDLTRVRVLAGNCHEERRHGLCSGDGDPPSKAQPLMKPQTLIPRAPAPDSNVVILDRAVGLPQPVSRPEERFVAPDVVEEVVRELCAMQRNRTLTALLDIGALVVERLFEGDLEQARKRGRKDHSLRKLATHPHLPFSAATLWRAIAIYELVRRFPGLIAAKTLGVAHIRAVLGLPGPIQERLLRSAELEKWTSERLESIAAEHRRMPKGPGGRPALPPLLKAATRLERILSDAPLVDRGALQRMSAAQKEHLRAVVMSTRDWCDAVDHQLVLDGEPAIAIPA
jgi:hypothetical protein